MQQQPWYILYWSSLTLTNNKGFLLDNECFIYYPINLRFPKKWTIQQNSTNRCDVRWLEHSNHCLQSSECVLRTVHWLQTSFICPPELSYASIEIWLGPAIELTSTWYPQNIGLLHALSILLWGKTNHMLTHDDHEHNDSESDSIFEALFQKTNLRRIYTLQKDESLWLQDLRWGG